MSGRTAARSALAGERLLPIVLAVAALGRLVVTVSAWIPHLRVLRSEHVDEVEGLHPGLIPADSLYLADVWEVGERPLAAPRALSSFLPEEPLLDLQMFGGAMIPIGAAALSGALGPMLRATSVTPARVIRTGEEVGGGLQ